MATKQTEKTIQIRAVKPSVLSGDDATRKANLKLRCGDCAHYNGSPHANFGQACSTIGVRVGSEAPECYTPNVSLLRDLGTPAFQALAAVVAAATPQQARILAGLLRAASSLERAGFTFMQKVYFSIGGSDPTLDRLYSGYVLGVGADKQIQVVGSDYLKQARAACVATLDKSSVMTFAQFKKLKDRLIAEGKWKSLPPKQRDSTILLDSYEPPTYETSPEALEARANKVLKRTKSKKPATVARGSGRTDGKLFSISDDAL